MATPYENLNIPSLHEGERISNWEKFFRAGVAPLLAREGGAKLAVGMLPAYICRRRAERETVRDVVNEAFETLRRCLDPPVDPQQSLLTLCHKEWEPGIQIDDYYELAGATQVAEAPLRMACLVLVSQLPSAVQSSLKEWVAAHNEVTKPLARDFVVLVRKLLTEKGIPLDRGNRDLSRLLEVRSSKDEDLVERDRVVSHHSQAEKPRVERSPGHVEVETDNQFDEVNTIKRQYRGRGRGIPRGAYSHHTSKSRGKAQACFICGDTSHFQRRCPHQFCQHFGKQGHGRRDCFSYQPVQAVEPAELQLDSGSEVPSGVVIRVCLNGYTTQALLDSGAQPSIVDVRSLNNMGLAYRCRRGKVHGVCSTPIETMGDVELRVDVGGGEVVNHKFTVLSSPEPTIILGRDFLRRYASTEFDWENSAIFG